MNHEAYVKQMTDLEKSAKETVSKELIRTLQTAFKLSGGKVSSLPSIVRQVRSKAVSRAVNSGIAEVKKAQSIGRAFAKEKML